MCAAAVSLYQLLICHVTDYYLFCLCQLLQVFNHLPAVIEARIGRSPQTDPNEKTRLFMSMMIPMSVAFAAGPFLAVQVLYVVNPTLRFSQTLCGLLSLIIMPLIYLLPDDSAQSVSLPDEVSYKSLLQTKEILTTLLLVTVSNCFESTVARSSADRSPRTTKSPRTCWPVTC